MQIPILHTDRLILRERSAKVLDYVFQQLSRGAQMAFLGVETETEYEEERKKYQAGYRHWYVKYQMWDLLLQENGQLIGRCGYHSWFPMHQRAEVGYFLDEERWEGKGLMTEALTRVLQEGFGPMQLNRVEAMVSPDNDRSLKLLKRFGFQQEGRLREHYRKEEEVLDSLVFSLLRSEWRKG